MNGIDEILHEDDVKSAIDELCTDIRDFGQIVFVHLLWGNKDGKSTGRYYGELDTLLGNLERAKFLLLTRESEGELE